MAIDKQIKAERRRLVRELADLGMVLPGSLSHRPMRCGRPNCRCHADPPVLHGPYWLWTRKVKNKTVTRMLTDEQVADYAAWFENMHRLRQLVEELEALGVRAVADDPRSRRQPGGRRPKT